MVPVVEALAGEVRGVDRHDEARGRARAPSRPGRRLLNDVSASLARRRRRARRRASSRCTARAVPPTCSSTRSTTTSSGRSAEFLEAAAATARAAGVAEVYVDPGIGFGKTVRHNLQLLAALPELVALGVPGARGNEPQGLPRPSRCRRVARRAGRGRSRPRSRGPFRRLARLGGVGDGVRRCHAARPRRRRHRPGGPSFPGGRGMRGRWAAGIVPRNFDWIIRDYLAVSERPGGYAAQPSQGAPPRGAALAAGARVHQGGVAPRIAAQPARL